MSSLQQSFEQPRLPSIEWLIPAALLVVVSTVVVSSAGEMLVWYTIRASGILAFLLLTASVVAGLLMTNRALPVGQPRVDLFDLHSFTALLAIVFSGVHGLALLLDTYIGFSPSQLLVPFTSSYRPFGVGIGIIGLYLVTGIYASFWAKRFIGHRVWRALHFGSFLGFLLAASHGILSGTDIGNAWIIGLYAASIALVLGLTARRMSNAKRGKVVQTVVRPGAAGSGKDSGQWA
jgi:predicted ferric reductase